MNRETLRRLKDRIERSPDPVTVYTNGKGVWCGTYVEEMGTYHALCKSYEADAIEAAANGSTLARHSSAHCTKAW